MTERHLTIGKSSPNSREKTETRILDAAERLFARHGVQAVSMRQIAHAAGASNNVAVQYHFGDRDGLIRAIFRRRLPSIERRAATLLHRLTEGGRLEDPAALVEALMRPLAEEKNEDGTRSYSAFLIGLHHFEGSFELRRQASDLAPLTTYISTLLHQALPQPMPEPLFLRRIGAAADAFNRYVTTGDRLTDARSSMRLSEDACIQEALNIATAIMTAPVQHEVISAIERCGSQASDD